MERGIAKCGAATTGTWVVYLSIELKYDGFGTSFASRRLRTLLTQFMPSGMESMAFPSGVYCRKPIANSIGAETFARRHIVGERVGVRSQIPPLSRRSATVDGCDWPITDRSYREPNHREGILMLDGHRIWSTVTPGRNTQI